MPMPNTSPPGNLLTEALIACRLDDGQRQSFSLPGVLALLANPGQHIESFSALQAHQAHAWHAFTVQLAAMVCLRARVGISDSVCRDENWWRERLRDLAGGESAWTLLVEDVRQPAFMQPAVPEGTLDFFKSEFVRPDVFDVVVTSKNHDRKTARSRASPDTWLPALIASQTMQGYSGRFNYGVFRMNGGLGNRPGIGFARPDDLGSWFRDDVTALLTNRKSALEHGFNDQGHSLLWAVPWDGKESLSLSALDPWCVECCRRVRLVLRDGNLLLLQAPTEVARVDVPSDLTGNVGDPWTPVAKTDGKALTLPAEGFSYRRAQDLLFGADWVAPATQQKAQEGGTWVARTLVRGQGKTEGFHERHIPIGPRVQRLLAEPSSKERLAKRAKEYVADVSAMRSYVLWPALKALSGEYADPSEVPLMAFETEADARFFSHLLEDQHLDDEGVARRSWQRHLCQSAKAILNGVLATAAPGAARRWRRIAEAGSRFNHGLYTHFPALMETSVPEAHA